MINFIQTYSITTAGIAASVLFPIISGAVRRYFPGNAAQQAALEIGFRQHLWNVAKPYLIVAIFSLVGAALIVAFLPTELNNNPQAAFLAGYTCDSTIQKIKG